MKKVIFGLIVMFGLFIQAQSISVTYLEKGIYPDNPEFNFENVWLLKVNKGISLYSPLNEIKDETETKEFEVNGEIQTAPSTMYNNYNIYFKNKEKNEQIILYHFLGVDYIVTENINKIAWEITNQTKMIDTYTCRLAIANQDGYPLKAWFTDEIPVSIGPKNLNDLPGLIMEYSIGFTQVVVKEISFNKELIISPPNLGKKITKEELLKIQKEAYRVPEEETTVETNGNTTITTTKYTEVNKIMPKKGNN